MSQVKFDGPPSPPSEPPGAERLRLARSALSLLNGPGASRWEPRWRYWVVAVERIGRVTLPADVRGVLGVGEFVSGVTGDVLLLLRPYWCGCSAFDGLPGPCRVADLAAPGSSGSPTR